jgi:hypothetical protein
MCTPVSALYGWSCLRPEAVVELSFATPTFIDVIKKTHPYVCAYCASRRTDIDFNCRNCGASEVLPVETIRPRDGRVP